MKNLIPISLAIGLAASVGISVVYFRTSQRTLPPLADVDNFLRRETPTDSWNLVAVYPRPAKQNKNVIEHLILKLRRPDYDLSSTMYGYWHQLRRLDRIDATTYYQADHIKRLDLTYRQADDDKSMVLLLEVQSFKAKIERVFPDLPCRIVTPN